MYTFIILSVRGRSLLLVSVTINFLVSLRVCSFFSFPLTVGCMLVYSFPISCPLCVTTNKCVMYHSVSSRHGNLFLYPPPANLPHRLLIATRQLRGTQQRPKHRPRVLATAVPENFPLIPLARLAIKRVAYKQLSPHARSDRTIKEVRVVRRAVSKQVSELCLPAGAGHVRHDTALAV
jgi:hypothetical protein